MSSQLSAVAGQLLGSGVDADVKTFTNTDGSVDGMLRVSVPRNMLLNNLLLDLEEYFEHWWKLHCWASFKALVANPEGVTSPDFRFRGLDNYVTNSQRIPGKLASLFLTSRFVARNIKKKGRPKPRQIHLRVFWSPHGERLTRGRIKRLHE